MTRDEFDALYLQGSDAVFEIIQRLESRLKALENQAAKNSNNSSKPPSSDGLSKATLTPMPQTLRKKSGRRAGGQQGHVGKTLLMTQTPDHLLVHRPLSCPHCHTNLQDVAPIDYTQRQVLEMPVPRVVVTEHRALRVCCPGCARECRAPFPDGVNQPVQYGPHLLGFATYLHTVHLLPYARCARIVQEITQAPFSPGSLHTALARAAERLKDFDDQLQATLSQVPLLHVDETGTRVKGKLNWFHVRCTDTLCRLFCHEKRGKQAVDDLRSYSGRLLSDFFSNYVTLGCQHQFCGAHLLRELTFAHEVLGQDWAGSLKSVMEAMVAACHRARDRGFTELRDASAFVREFDRWVQEGLKQNPPPRKPPGKKRVARGKVRCLLDRLVNHREGYFAFLFDLSIPFTNNEAERAIRMFKVKSKVSGGFRTKAGADAFCRLRSYTQTCQKQGMCLMDCLRSVFNGKLILPSLNHA